MNDLRSSDSLLALDSQAQPAPAPEPSGASAAVAPEAVASDVGGVTLKDAAVRTPWRSYKESVSLLAQRVVEGQRPIRVLNSIKWPPDVFERFRDSNWKELPQIGPEEYARQPLGFDLELKIDEFRELEAATRRELGADDPIGRIIEANAREYGDLVEMLKARGTPRFYELSRTLYGSALDFFSDRKTRVRDVARDMYEILTNLDDAALGPQPERTIVGERAVEMLNERLNAFFGDGRVRVMLDDGIVADAAAGGDY